MTCKAHDNKGCLAAGTREGKVVYHRSTLKTLKPKPFEPHPKDPNLDKETGAKRSEHERRMLTWQDLWDDAEPD